MRREDDDEKRARKKRTKSTHATAISSASSASIAAACSATLLSVVERTFWLFSIRKGVKDLSRFRAREKWRLFFVLKVPCFFKGRKENLA